MSKQLNIQTLMQEELVAAKARNPGYSLRAFARRIGLYSSTVSEILNGGRPVTRKMAVRILKGLGTPPDQSMQILAGLGASKRSTKKSQVLQFAQVDMDQFHVISDWYYFAILSLADTDDFVGEADWVADRLGIKLQDARIALKRLERLQMLIKDPQGQLQASGKQFTTSADISHVSLRKHHYQNLELARRSLDCDEVLEREFTFINMAADPKKLPQIKRRIREFRDSLCAEFESGSRQEVYKMCIQLFPLTKSPKKRKSL